MNSLKQNPDCSNSAPKISPPSQWVMSHTSMAMRNVLDTPELTKNTRIETWPLENKLHRLCTDYYRTSEHNFHATGDIHHSQFGLVEDKHQVLPESIVTSQFRIMQGHNALLVPEKLYISEIVRARTSIEMEARLKWARSNAAYATTPNNTSYPKGITTPIAWEVINYSMARGTIILHLSRPSTLQNNENRLLKLSIGESEFGMDWSAFFIEKEQYVSWIKFDPNTGRTTTGGLVIMGHSAGSNGYGSGVRKIHLAPTENKAPKEGFGSLAKNILRSLIRAKSY